MPFSGRRTPGTRRSCSVRWVYLRGVVGIFVTDDPADRDACGRVSVDPGEAVNGQAERNPTDVMTHSRASIGLTTVQEEHWVRLFSCRTVLHEQSQCAITTNHQNRVQFLWPVKRAEFPDFHLSSLEMTGSGASIAPWWCRSHRNLRLHRASMRDTLTLIRYQSP